MDLPEQDLTVNIEYKQSYGEVHTPYKLIERMFTLFPDSIFSDPTKKWLDPGAGKGYFSIYLFEKLMIGLAVKIPDISQRREHILSNMIWLIELNEEHISILKSQFNNVYHLDFLTTERETFPDYFDVIIGNPPFNFGGLKKVPTNNERNKKQDGKTIWSKFIKHSVSLLRERGLLLFIVPSIWMKEDKEKMYFYMTQYQIHKLHCLTNTQMNAYFKGHAQTPSCFFLMEKKSTEKTVLIYDNDYEKYIPFHLRPEHILPVSCAHILTQILPYVNKYGSLKKMIKTNLPSNSIKFSKNKKKTHPYTNIKTCVIKDKIRPELVLEYSDKPGLYYGKKKLILAHGMYGFPFIDAEGKYGISNRDKYVYLCDDIFKLKRLHQFLSSDLVFYLYDATRYRMKYLEKYIFSYLPDIVEMTNEEVNNMINNIKLPHNKNKYTTIT